MLMKVTYPVFIFEGQDLSVFLTAKDLSDYIEWYDVEDGIFRGFDFTGRHLGLLVDENKDVQCKILEGENGNDELMKRVRTLLRDSTPPIGISDNENATKAVAVGLFVERSRTAPTVIQWLKSCLGQCRRR
jgi:hypothetical protein